MNLSLTFLKTCVLCRISENPADCDTEESFRFSRLNETPEVNHSDEWEAACDQNVWRLACLLWVSCLGVHTRVGNQGPRICFNALVYITISMWAASPKMLICVRPTLSPTVVWTTEGKKRRLCSPFISSSSLKLPGNTLCLMSPERFSSIRCSLGSIFPLPVLIMMIGSNVPNGFSVTKITSCCRRIGVKFDQEAAMGAFRAWMKTTDQQMSVHLLYQRKGKLSRLADKSQNQKIGPTSEKSSITNTGSDPKTPKHDDVMKDTGSTRP